MSWSVPLVAALASLSVACAPMTFSDEGEIDFSRYSSVRVVVDAEYLLDGSTYLAGELRESSGFERVTTDPNESVSLVLTANVTVAQVTTNDNGETEVKYDGSGHFLAATPAGKVVLEDDESDTSETESEAAEDVLDEISLRFIAPYRI